VLHDGKQIAAFQYMIKETVWISKEISSTEAKAIMATIAGLFATTKAGYMSGY
jgi:hypothetical protein